MSKNSEVKLAKIVADLAIFLEFTSEDLLDPDLAVEAMEQVAAELQLLDAEDKKNLSTIFIDLSHEYKGEQSEYVMELPEFLGLV